LEPQFDAFVHGMLDMDALWCAKQVSRWSSASQPVSAFNCVSQKHGTPLLQQRESGWG